MWKEIERNNVTCKKKKLSKRRLTKVLCCKFMISQKGIVYKNMSAWQRCVLFMMKGEESVAYGPSQQMSGLLDAPSKLMMRSNWDTFSWQSMTIYKKMRHYFYTQNSSPPGRTTTGVFHIQSWWGAGTVCDLWTFHSSPWSGRHPHLTLDTEYRGNPWTRPVPCAAAGTEVSSHSKHSKCTKRNPGTYKM